MGRAPRVVRLFTCCAVVAVAAAIAGATVAHAVPSYGSRVPNGREFRCLLCHTRTNGGEGWDPFGQDVLRQDPDVTEADLAGSNENAHFNMTPVWDAFLCGGDSDGDGQTNGQELGDPACSWTFGAFAPRRRDISDPGDAGSYSADPDGIDPPPEGEGEGEPFEGEGEVGEGEGELETPGCSSSSGPTGAALLLVVMRRARRARHLSQRSAPQ